jgi:hypothetical protein
MRKYNDPITYNLKIRKIYHKQGMKNTQFMGLPTHRICATFE